ncbi:MAG: Sec-independent protein translocase protein TatB [Desulfobacterales bacterium]
MFGIGMPELIVIAVIALIVIGPEKLPGLAKTLGRMFGELKKATNEFKETIDVESKLTDVKKAFEDINEKEAADKAEIVHGQEIDKTESVIVDKNNEIEKDVSKESAQDERG